jgi:hypothetical protein
MPNFAAIAACAVDLHDWSDWIHHATEEWVSPAGVVKRRVTLHRRCVKCDKIEVAIEETHRECVLRAQGLGQLRHFPTT